MRFATALTSQRRVARAKGVQPVTYLVQSVGQPMGPFLEIEAASPHHAVEIAAGCHPEDVGLPIWRAGPRFNGSWERECYMPRDDSGRQWLVHTSGPRPNSNRR